MQSFLYFNTHTENAGIVSIATNYGTAWEKKYVCGHGIKNYDFAIVYTGLQDDGTSKNNVQEMFNAEKFMLWIDEQNKKKNFPCFDGAQVLSIENLQNQPTFSGVSTNGALAKYMMQIRVRYYI